MIEFKEFISHSGLTLPFKINCDDFTDDDWRGLAQIVQRKISFSRVIGVPQGGLKFAEALRPYRTKGHGLLLVDDVMTTGRSMKVFRSLYDPNYSSTPITIGVVVFARRASHDDWIRSIFTVNEWIEAANE